MSDMNSRHNRAVWIDIPVADLERASAFYAAVLGVPIHQQSFDGRAFAVIEHNEGNGGCLVVHPEQVTSTGGILVYLNVDGRIRDAVVAVGHGGGNVLEPIHSIGPHGFRAIVLDSEGNRLALHSNTDA